MTKSADCYMVLCFDKSDGLMILPTEYHNKQEAINVAQRRADDGSCFETCVVAEYPTESVEEWSSKDGFVSRLIDTRGY